MSSLSSDSPMDLNTRKEEFSYAYIHAIASIAGFVVDVNRRAMDSAGLDLTIVVPGELEFKAFPRLNIQVKCTADIDIVSDESVSFPLPVRNYNILRSLNSASPLLLVVMLVPTDIEEWSEVSNLDTLTILRKCAYWISLKGMQETLNTSTVTINIPRQNLLDPTALVQLMKKVARGEEI